MPRLPAATPPLPQDCFPGPGTYGPRGNPYICLEERDKQSASTRGLMDSRTAKCALPAAVASPAPCPGDTRVGWPCPTAERSPRCLSPPCLQGSGLGPGTYHLQSSIDEGLRRAGGPGPCQPFSGDRSKPAGGGHHALEVSCPGTTHPDEVSQRAAALPTHCYKDRELPYDSICPAWILLFVFPWILEKYTHAAVFGERAGCRHRAGERAGACEQRQG